MFFACCLLPFEAIMFLFNLFLFLTLYFIMAEDKEWTMCFGDTTIVYNGGKLHLQVPRAHQCQKSEYSCSWDGYQKFKMVFVKRRVLFNVRMSIRGSQCKSRCERAKISYVLGAQTVGDSGSEDVRGVCGERVLSFF
jgi:hypothetical protein